MNLKFDWNGRSPTSVFLDKNGVYPHSDNMCFRAGTSARVKVIGGKGNWDPNTTIFGLTASDGRYIIVS